MTDDPYLKLAYALDVTLWVEDALGVSLDIWQERFLRSTAPELLCLAVRQSGKSTAAAWLAGHAMLHLTPCTTVAVSPSMRQSAELVRKVKDVLDQVDERLTVNNAFALELANGSRLLGVPGGERGVTARGLSVDLLIVDEAAFISDDVLAATRPMLVARRGSRLVMISSAGPVGTRFHARWTSADPTVERIEVLPADCPRLDPDRLAVERGALGQRAYGREFENRFTSAGVQLFSEQALAHLFGTPTADDLDDDDPVVAARPLMRALR